MLRVDEIKEEKNELLVKQEDTPASVSFTSTPGPSGESRPAWSRVRKNPRADFIRNFFDAQKKAVASRKQETVDSIKRYHDEAGTLSIPEFLMDPQSSDPEGFIEARKRAVAERRLKEKGPEKKVFKHASCQTQGGMSVNRMLEMEHFGKTILELNLDMFPKSQEIDITNNGNIVIENIFNNLEILRKEIDPTGRRTVFGSTCKLLKHMTGVTGSYVHSLRRQDLEPTKKSMWNELDSAGEYMQLITEIQEEYVLAIKEYVESSWANDYAPTIEDCRNWTQENLNLKVKKSQMTKILKVLKLRSTDRQLPDGSHSRKNYAASIFLDEIEKARHENCYISYFSAQKFGETTIFSQFVDTGILEKSIEITETENFYTNLDDYMSRQIPFLAKEAKKLGRKAVIVVDRQYQLVFEGELPCPQTKRWQLIKFMRNNGQPYVEAKNRATVYENVEECIEKLGGRTRINKRELEKVAKKENVQVIRLPRTEYVLNPMELILGELLSHITDETEEEIRKAVQNWEANIDEKMTEVCYEDIFEKEMAMRKKLENDYKDEDEDFL